jgi:hypothetical protein
MLASYGTVLRKLLWAFILALLLFCVGLNSAFVENVYTRHLYQYISVPLRFISGLLPFPLGDVLYLLLILYVLRATILFIKRLLLKQLNKEDAVRISFLLLRLFLVLYIVFKLLWGLNYSRHPINKQLGIADEKYNQKELIALGNFLIQRINQVQATRSANKPTRYTLPELKNGAVDAYAKLARQNVFFSYRQPAVKKVLNTWLITKIGLEGYYSPLSGEANINMRIPATSLPFVTCHEIAHQLGVGREDEANLVGYLVSTSSTDLNFQYSGYYAVLKNVLFEIRFKAPEAYEATVKKLNRQTVADFKRDRQFWMHYNSDMYMYMDVALDSFLKLNNQDKGIDSYQDIVIWLFNIHKAALNKK